MPELFVYGSLRRGFHNHYRMGDGTFRGEARLAGARLYSLGPYPTIVFTGDPDEWVAGEIYTVAPEILAGITEMELEADYLLKTVEIAGWVCSIYFFEKPPEGAEWIPSGDWALARTLPAPE